MTIVPSGTRRLIKLQQVAGKIGPAKRDSVQQEDIPAEGGQPPAGGNFNPIGKLDNTLQQQKQQPSATNVPDQQDLNDAVGGEDPEIAGKVGPDSAENGSSSQQVGDDFRDAYFSVMQSLGIEPRMFNHPEHAEKFFHIDEEVIGRGEAKGFFILPSKTKSKAITKQEAWGIAKKLGSEFGVTKMNFSYAPGNNYKFTFQVLVQDNSDMSGSSLDALISRGKQSPTAKAAYSKNSIIKESGNSIVNSLIKQGFGGNHAS